MLIFIKNTRSKPAFVWRACDRKLSTENIIWMCQIVVQQVLRGDVMQDRMAQNLCVDNACVGQHKIHNRRPETISGDELQHIVQKHKTRKRRHLCVLIHTRYSYTKICANVPKFTTRVPKICAVPPGTPWCFELICQRDTSRNSAAACRHYGVV